VQRWETEEGLPIRRHKHSDRDSVYAFKPELDEWLLSTGAGGSGLGTRGAENGAQPEGAPAHEQEAKGQEARVLKYGTDNLLKSRRPWEASLRYGLVLLALAIVGVAAHYWGGPPPASRLIGFKQITNDGRDKGGNLVTDGENLYFLERLPAGKAIVKVSVSGGEPQALSAAFKEPKLLDFNLPRREFLVGDPTNKPGPRPPLWVLPLSGGQPRRVGNVSADAAAWSPDGKSLAYSAGQDLYIGKSDGSELRKIARVPVIAESILWSPDGRRLRVTLGTPEVPIHRIWELRSDGSHGQELFGNWPINGSLEGRAWTPDGRYFFYTRGLDASELWVARDGARTFWGRGREEPVRLTSVPFLFGPCAASLTGKRVFFLGRQQRQEILRFDNASQSFIPYLAGVSGDYLDFSRDGQWVAYIETTVPGSLWRRRQDGSQARQLTFPPLRVQLPRWSPDGEQIAFLGQRSPEGGWQVYVIPADGGAYQPLLPSSYREGAPTWSPDGSQVAFGELAIGDVRAAPMSIHVVNLRTHKATTLPGSTGLWTARWSPDGQHMAALTADSRTLMVFDFHRQRWEKMATATSISDLNWSRDSAWIYFEDSIPPDGPAVFRVRLQDRHAELVASLKHDPPLASSWFGLTPQGSVLISNPVGTAEIYALDWEGP
jgi:Tol biopolymer transport system component